MYAYGFIFYFIIWPITNFLLKKILPPNNYKKKEEKQN